MAAAMKRYSASPKGKRTKRAVNRRWYRMNAEAGRTASRRTRELRYGIDEPLPAGYEAFIFNAFGNTCARCNSAGPLELDHHRPMQKGYPLLHNAVPLCRNCNAQKHAMDPWKFYGAWRGMELDILLDELQVLFERKFQPCS
ncbi:HNH endonuclease [Corallococcus sp. M34]|uniref:HNH endonuclease signature motif containing protein n=1 Tax=Citreicoccus inhibens TaxID=2849499 RepID=UPI001C2491E0|nr:HNH endonuclease signature motif containing protein [Citreicoccus inhibens]MBU8900649.1 HNH endonuclease [Citreicoccus inhibens]